jgi:hypothetical protein
MLMCADERMLTYADEKDAQVRRRAIAALAELHYPHARLTYADVC